MANLVYRSFTRKALDAAYDNALAVADSTEILAGFEKRSLEISKFFSETMDISYGNRPRQKFDYFPGNPGAGIFVFIHGGYWQMRHKDTFRFLAKGPLSLGFHVASIGYTLAPDITLSEIVNEIREAIESVRYFSKKFQADDQKIIVSGWSAGAHLAAMTLDEESVVAAFCISGIYDLEPISKCYLNDALNLSEEEILNLSPLRIPCVPKPAIIVCGEEELPELQRQSIEFAELRAKERIPVTFGLIPGCNHFTILSELENPEGVLVQHLKTLG